MDLKNHQKSRRTALQGLAVAALSVPFLSACGAPSASSSGAPSASSNRAIVERLYEALRNKDADGVRAAIEEGFAPDAINRISESMPYGGTTTGREAILELFAAFVTATTPIIPTEQITVERMVEEDNSVVAWVAFPWIAPGATESIPMWASEWFIFRDGLVSEMVVSYWDTAACLAAVEAATANS
jgi:ketosteroid isomerase-like protein